MIKQFVDLPDLSSDELANNFTMASAEVEDVIDIKKIVSQLMVKKILKVENHPKSKKLKVVLLEDMKIVSNILDLKVADFVVVAKVGVKLSKGFVEKSIVQGEVSEGKLVALEDIFLEESSSTIMKFDHSVDLLDHLKDSLDIILEVDNKSLTHRPDLWGHVGLAREFSAYYNLPMKNPQDYLPLPVAKELKITEPACLAFNVLEINDLKVTPSACWLVRELSKVGIKSVNNVVDILNYSMLITGFPFHAYDRDMVEGALQVKRLDGEFKALDGKVYGLSQDVVVCDEKNILSLAGIMGAENSKVSLQTKNILLEAANWQDFVIRKTATRLGVRTDSSSRYEKSLDSFGVEDALRFCASLLATHCSGRVGELATLPLIQRPSGSTIIMEQGAFSRILGIDVSFDKVRSILTRLGFEISQITEERVEIGIPSFRNTKDVSLPCDIVEEVGRMIGYDNIPESPPLGLIAPVRMQDNKRREREIKDFLVSNSYNEIMTYPLVGDELLSKMKWTSRCDWVLENPLSVQSDRMRNSLIPQMMEVALANQRNYEEFSVFEHGRTYHKEGGEVVEREAFCLGTYSKSASKILSLLDDVIGLLKNAKISYTVEPWQDNPWVPFGWNGVNQKEACVLRVQGEIKAVVFSVHPLALRDIKLKGSFALAIVDQKLPTSGDFKYTPLNKYQENTFDFTVALGEVQEVEDLIRVLNPVSLGVKICRIVDVFEKNITFRAIFGGDKNYSPEDIKKVEGNILKVLKENSYIVK